MKQILQYRVAAISDCEILTTLRLDMRKERDQSFHELELRENTLSFFQKNIENKTHIAFLCFHEEIVIATAGLSLFEMPPTDQLKNGKVAKLMNMYTIPSYRNQGIATAMLKFVIEYASEHEYYKIMLNSSPMGKHLYEKNGFIKIENEYSISLL